MTGVIDLCCIVCGGSFLAEKKPQGRHRRFCSPACRRQRHLTQLDRYRAEGRYRGRPRIAPANRRLITKVCEVCQTPFQTPNSKTVCCGIACGTVLASRRSATTRTAKSIAQRQRVCEQCGVPFVARHPSGSGIAGRVREGRFCSRRCAGAFRSAAAGGGQLALRGVTDGGC
jgi:hypothetical protein